MLCTLRAELPRTFQLPLARLQDDTRIVLQRRLASPSKVEFTFSPTRYSCHWRNLHPLRSCAVVCRCPKFSHIRREPGQVWLFADRARPGHVPDSTHSLFLSIKEVLVATCPNSSFIGPGLRKFQTPSTGFQCNPTQCNIVTPRSPSSVGIHFGFLNLADFKGIRAGQHFQ
jgi:hypothetical protein